MSIHIMMLLCTGLLFCVHLHKRTGTFVCTDVYHRESSTHTHTHTVTHTHTHTCCVHLHKCTGTFVCTDVYHRESSTHTHTHTRCHTHTHTFPHTHHTHTHMQACTTACVYMSFGDFAYKQLHKDMVCAHKDTQHMLYVVLCKLTSLFYHNSSHMHTRTHTHTHTCIHTYMDFFVWYI